MSSERGCANSGWMFVARVERRHLFFVTKQFGGPDKSAFIEGRDRAGDNVVGGAILSASGDARTSAVDLVNHLFTEHPVLGHIAADYQAVLDDATERDAGVVFMARRVVPHLPCVGRPWTSFRQPRAR